MLCDFRGGGLTVKKPYRLTRAWRRDSEGEGCSIKTFTTVTKEPPSQHTT